MTNQKKFYELVTRIEEELFVEVSDLIGAALFGPTFALVAFQMKANLNRKE